MIVPICLSVAAHQTHRWFKRKKCRTDMFARAQARANELGRPLLVVGDPDGGVTHGDYGYGDVCVDLTGCPNAPKGIKADLSKGIPLPSDKYVVFVSYILEYVDDLEKAWSEIQRVAGSTDNVFVLFLHPHLDVSTFFLYPGTKWVILQAPPDSDTLLFKPFIQRFPIRRRCF